MTAIVPIHSFRGGTGKSNLTANLAVCTAMQGLRVGIMDTDIQSPGVHVLFDLDDSQIRYALNDYLWGRCPIEETAYDVTPPQAADVGGSVALIPSSIKVGEITRVLREGYDVGLLNDGFQELGVRLALDALFIDTHPGLNEETLLAIALSDVTIVLLRPDRQDFLGTAVTVDVAKRLGVPRLLMAVNKTPLSLDVEALRLQVEAAYDAPVACILPESNEMLELASAGLFCLRHPEHYITAQIQRLAARVLCLDSD